MSKEDHRRKKLIEKVNLNQDPSLRMAGRIIETWDVFTVIKLVIFKDFS